MLKAALLRLRTVACLRDPMTIVFDRRAGAVLLAIILLAAAGVAANLHQSSIAKWNDYLPSATDSAVFHVGTPRAVRSDEWLVSTPWMLSQMANRSALDNPNVGAGHSTLLTSMPVKHLSALLQPEFWGFQLLGSEHGFAWLWMYRLFGLLGSIFLLLMILTKGDTTVSVVGAISVCFASFTQWWFSTNLPELLIGFALSLIGLVYVLQSGARVGIAAGAMLLVLGASTFVFQLYPPFQVATGYLALAVIAGLSADPQRRARLAEHLWTRLACLLASALILVAAVYVFWMDAGATIDAVMDTSYPGKRATVGGDATWWSTFNGYFEAWRIGEESVPLPPTNPSEAGNFALFFPFVVAAMLWSIPRTRHDPVVVAVAVFCVALAAWMMIPLGSDLAVPLAKWSLLSFVPTHRALVALGVGSCLLVALWVAWLRRTPHPQGRMPLWTVPVLALGVAGTGLFLAGLDAMFFTWERVAMGTLVAAMVGFAIARGNLIAYAVAVGLLAVPAITVNPVSRGLGPLLDKASMRAVVAESRRSPGGVLWLVVGSFVIPQSLKANGVPTFGGATYLPDAARMRVLDPDGSYADVWNRYAHIQIESAPEIERPEFRMIDAPGLYGISLDVCSDFVQRLGVTHVAYVTPPSGADRECMLPVHAGPVDGLWLFRLRSSQAARGQAK